MKLFTGAAFAIAAAAIGFQAHAQDFPTGPITIVNPYSAGGPADLISRSIAEGMTEILGQPVVVENRPGAATAIAATHVAQSDADGYTLLIAGSPTHIVTPALQDVSYEGISDFAPVAQVAVVPNVLVVPSSSGIDSVEALVAKASERADAVAFASVGNGSLPHFASTMFQIATETQLLHIPYGGAAPAVVDLLAGNVDMAFLNVPPMMAYFESGELTPLAVAAGERSAQIPDVPTMEELGYEGFQMSTWYGISAPAGTPKDVIDAISSAIEGSLATDSVRERLTNQGVLVVYRNADDFGAFLAEDVDRMLNLIDVAGLRNQ